jgi:hypothetical protein
MSIRSVFIFSRCHFFGIAGIDAKLRAAVLVAACLPLAVAQSPQEDPAPSSSATHQPSAIDKVLGWVAPGQPTHLTEKDRFQLYLVNTVGPVPLIGEAAAAGIGQWANRPKEWGQGWGAFGERYGSDLAYNAVRQTVAYGTSIMFREDNRYFASQKHGFWPRTKHALASTFIARHPDGSSQFSVSAMSGVVGASAISSIWGPASWKGGKNIAENAGITIATTAGLNVVREFLMDILHRTK